MFFVNFSPAVSNTSKKAIGQEMHGWKVHLRSDKSLEDISRMFNSILRGWINDYAKYYKSELYPVFRHFNLALVRWATRKYKKVQGYILPYFFLFQHEYEQEKDHLYKRKIYIL